MEKYRRLIFLSIIIIALGVVISTTQSEKVGGLGTVFIAIGGLLFIAGMSEKKKFDEKGNEKTPK